VDGAGAGAGADGLPASVSGPAARRDELASVPVSGAATTNSATTAAAVALNMHARRIVRFRRAPTSLRIPLPLNFPPYSLARRDSARVSWGICTTRRQLALRMHTATALQP